MKFFVSEKNVAYYFLLHILGFDLQNSMPSAQFSRCLVALSFRFSSRICTASGEAKFFFWEVLS